MRSWLSLPALSLQRSRRSSRRTSRESVRADDSDGGASTEPSFFTTDKLGISPNRGVQAGASTEPSFFTTDKGWFRGLVPWNVGASTEPSFFTTDKLTHHDSAHTYECSFNGAVVLHDGQAGAAVQYGGDVQKLQRSRRSSRRTRCSTSSSMDSAPGLQRSRRSSRRTRLWCVVMSSEKNWLQRSRRSSRRTRRYASSRPSPDRRSFNGAVVLHDGQAANCTR